MLASKISTFSQDSGPSLEEAQACRDGADCCLTVSGTQKPEMWLTSFLCSFIYRHSLWLFVFVAMLQADDEDDMMEMQMKSPFGSSFRTFNATDYKPIGKISLSFFCFKHLLIFPNF